MPKAAGAYADEEETRKLTGHAEVEWAPSGGGRGGVRGTKDRASRRRQWLMILAVAAVAAAAVAVGAKAFGGAPGGEPAADGPNAAAYEVCRSGQDGPDVTPPESFEVVYETSIGSFTVHVNGSWAPAILTQRYYLLATLGYNAAARFYRVDYVDTYSESVGFPPRPPWVVQWGYNGDPALQSCWEANMTMSCSASPSAGSPGNLRGTVAFGLSENGTCSTELYINYSDNSRLDAAGFAPIGRVSEEDMQNVVDRLYPGYGEVSELCASPPEGNCYINKTAAKISGDACDAYCHQAFCVGCGIENQGVDMDQFMKQGNAYLLREKPKLDFIVQEVLVK